MCEHAAVSFVGLTGSTEVGKILYGRACIGLKKLGLELAPFVEYRCRRRGRHRLQIPQHGPDLRLRQSPLRTASIYEEFLQKLSTKVAA